MQKLFDISDHEKLPSDMNQQIRQLISTGIGRPFGSQ
jgi:hypothetical protein